MYALLLTTLSFGAAANSQEDATHAKWHPSDAGLFLELPDVAAVCATYDRAPLLRLLNDAEIQAVFAALGDEEDTRVSVNRLAEWVGEMLEVEIPAESLQNALASLSMSLRHAEGEWGLTAVMDTKSEEVARELAGGIRELADEVKPHSLSGFETLTGDSSFELWLACSGSRIALGTNEDTAKHYSERLSGEGSSLAENKVFLQGRAKVGAATGTPMLMASYMGGFPIRESLPEGAVFDALAEDLNTPMAMWTSFHEQRFETRIFGATSDNLTGDMLGHMPLQKEWLDDLPDDAMLTYATTFDGKKMAAALQSWIEGVPELAVMTDDFDVKGALEDMLAPMGPKLLLSMQPVMGLGFPPTYIWVDSTDPAAFAKSFEDLAAKLGEKMPGIGARSRDYKVKNKQTGERTAVTYTSLTFPPELAGELGMFSPKLTFAQLDGRILFSTSSTALKGELKRLYNGEAPEPRDFMGKAGLSVPEGTRSVTVFDWGILLGKLVGIAKLMGPMAGDALPFDLNLLPQPAVFGRYLKPTVHIRHMTESGVMREHRSSFGLLTWAAATGALGGSLAFREEVEFEAVSESQHSEQPPADERVKSTRSSLRDLKAGIAIYKIENGELPDSMDQLVAPTEDYPKGYLGQLELPQDGWGQDFLYAKESSGYRLWSVGANGIDEGGSGDDVAP